MDTVLWTKVHSEWKGLTSRPVSTNYYKTRQTHKLYFKEFPQPRRAMPTIYVKEALKVEGTACSWDTAAPYTFKELFYFTADKTLMVLAAAERSDLG